jgi:TolB-like protein
VEINMNTKTPLLGPSPERDMAPSPSQFDDLELDPANFEVRHKGVPLRIGRIPLELLFLLARRAGRLVTYQEAFEAVWGKGVVIEVEAALYTAVRKLRRALAENPAQPRFIETIARKGYRFIALPIELDAMPQSPKRAEIPKRLILAVLPLENLSGRPKQDYFSDGLTEELLCELGRFSSNEWGVIARTSVMAYKGTRTSVAQIGAELGADYLIEGSTRHERGRVRIAVQLIRVNDQTHVWAEAFDRPLVHVLQVQTEVAKRVADMIRLKVVPSLGRSLTPDPQVQYRYLHSRSARLAAQCHTTPPATMRVERALECGPAQA